MLLNAKAVLLILLGGGPTIVINATWVGILQAALRLGVKRIYGSLFGVLGIAKEQFVDLTQLSSEELKLLAGTPSAALGTTRDMPDNAAMLEVIKAHGITHVIGVGGQDTAETLQGIAVFAQAAGYSLCVVHAPKTIDGDLEVGDHPPGFPSAARFIAKAAAGHNLENAAMPGVDILGCMGRNAGYLTGASGFLRSYDDDGPHLIYCPERALDLKLFLDDVDGVYQRLGRCLVAVSEGVKDSDGTLWVEHLKEVHRDAHGNVQLSGSAVVDFLASEVRKRLGVKRVISETPGYLQRCYDEASYVDEQEARRAGEAAARFAIDGQSGSVVITRTGEYEVEYGLVALEQVAGKTKVMPTHFINEKGNDITPAYVDYLRPLLGSFPKYARIKLPLVEKILNR